MPKILLNHESIEYELKRSRRSKRVSLSVNKEAKVVLTLPSRASEALAEEFIRAKAQWLIKQINFFKKRSNFSITKISPADYQKNKEQALKQIRARVDYFNQIYKFKFNRISIKNQTTRWGSCSRRGNLNFNFRLIFLPAVLMDYVVVHELCHLKEFNHSKNFWTLVAKTFPNYNSIRKNLKDSGLNLL